MRIIIAGDRFWNCHELAKAAVQRLIARYGPEVVIVHGGACGVDQSFAEACGELSVMAEVCLADFSHMGDYRFRNREMLRRGAGLCLIFHRSALDDASRDLARQAIAATVPTYLVDSDEGKPRRIRAELLP
jgi:hypothetical protein